MSALTRSEFESAVKDALRHYTQPDLLAGNALLHASLLGQSGTGAATPQALRALLADAAKGLFAGERDRRIYRVLDLTYFNPAPKQEAAAERLGLSFSTYRRHLIAGVDRLIEWLWQKQEAPQTEASASDLAQATSPSTRPHLSIVILPFLNLSGDASVDYIVDGIVDSLITDLSTHVVGSFVISRSTAFAYKGRSVPVRQVGSELGVRYVLEGSVSADARRIGVNVQLIDAETDEHIWAERFDKERRDIRQVQAEIVGRLSRSVGLEMVRAEVARRGPDTNSSDAEDLTMRGRALVHDVKQQEHAEEAIDLFRQALELDPDYVDAMAGIALARAYQVINLYHLEEREAVLDEAEHMVSRGMALSPDHFALLKARGLLLRARGRFSEALVANEALIARNPVEPTAYKEIGLNKLYLGETQEAVEWFRRADAIAPRDPDRWTWLQGLGRALIQLGHDSEAVIVLSQAIDSNPGYVRGRAWLAAAEALAGDHARAQRHLAAYMAVEPEMTVARFAEERSSVPLDVVSPVYRREIERILEGLRRAGMPDGVNGSPSRPVGSETIRPKAARREAELSAPPHPPANLREPVSGPRLAGEARAIDPNFTPDTGTAVPAAIFQPPDKPSIAVLPFQNMSGDPEQEYFADGIVEEIITALSRIRWLFVIARNSSFSYKGQAPDVKRVGRELGVRYVLEGSVRKAGGRLRIAAQLIDSVTSAHLWADHFDGSLEDVFDFQDRVASNVAGIIEPALQAAEAARSVTRPTDDLTAYDLYLRAYGMALPSAARFAEALRLLELAIDRDPRYGPALAWAAFCCNRLVIDGRSEDPAGHRIKGIDFARRALEVAGDDPAILANAAYALAYFGEDIGAMMALVDRALMLNPSFARGWHISGVLRVYAGQPDMAIEHAETSLRLSPRARVGWALFTIGAAHFYARRFKDAVPKLLLAMQEDPSLPNPYRYLAACYAHMGRLDEAREIFKQLQAVTAVAIPDLAYLRNAEHRELYVSGLRLAAGEAI